MVNHLRALAQALGGDVSGASVVVPGPGHSPRDRSLSITPSVAAPDGFLFFSHAGDDRKLCRDYILGRLGGRVEPPARQRPRVAAADRSGAPLALWEAAVDPRGTIVELYLTSRGLDLPDDVALRVVRFHPHCPFGPSTHYPTMVTVFRSIVTDAVQAIHRTALTADGKKIGRMMLGPVAGAAIKISADTDVEQGLAIGEGFETCLAGWMLGFRPVWALGSAGAIGTFPVASGIEAITLLAETDDSGANARAIKACAERWSAAGREVLVATPRAAGDMNDVLVA